MKIKKKYGLWTSIAMVVGVVIGSGVFFKADDVLALTNGNLILALLAWIIGAFSMIFGALVFSDFAHRIQYVNGVVDYSEVAYGKKIGYIVGWFKWTVYYSPLSAILAWVSAMYTLILFNHHNPANSYFTWLLAFIYLTLGYVMNYYSPLLAGKFQVTTTIIKLIPLTLIAIVGIIVGLHNDILINHITTAVTTVQNKTGSLTSAVVSTAFAYEGWIVATTINHEIIDSKKNLPKALVMGTMIVFIVYVTYFLGIAAVLSPDIILIEGDNAIKLAAKTLFGNIASVLITSFVVVSCLGTLNGLIISSIRTPLSLAIRNQGIKPKLLAIIHPKTTMPPISTLFALIFSSLYLFIWYGSLNNWFGQFIAIDEIPIVLIYGLYIFLYVWYIKTYKELSILKRYIIPILAIFGSIIILYGGITNPSIGYYLIISIVIILLGLIFYRE